MGSGGVTIDRYLGVPVESEGHREAKEDAKTDEKGGEETVSKD